MPPICRLLTFTAVASSVRIGLAAPPIFEPGMGELIVTTSLFTVLPVRLIPPGRALATQLFVLIQVASTGAFVQTWLAATAGWTGPVMSRHHRERTITKIRLWFRCEGVGNFIGRRLWGWGCSPGL